MLEGLDLSPRMAVRVAVPLDPPIRRVVWAAMVVLWWLLGFFGGLFVKIDLASQEVTHDRL